MRFSSVVIVTLATLVAGSSGCKVGKKCGVCSPRTASRPVARRASVVRSTTAVSNSLATRGTAECDCYNCRMKQQSTQSYVIEPAYEPMDAVEVTEQPTAPLSPVVDSNIEQPRYLTPDTAATEEEESPVLDPPPVEAQVQQEIQGRVIADENLTNQLPPEPSVDTQPKIQDIPEVKEQLKVQPVPKPAVEPQLISPTSGLNLMNRLEIVPVVQ